MRFKYSTKDLASRLGLNEETGSPLFISDRRYPKSVGVTGGAGYFASALIAELLKRGIKVHAFVRRPMISKNDLLVYHQVEDLFSLNSLPDIDILVHAAANTSTANSLEKSWHDNVAVTQKLFQKAQAQQIHFAHISSLSVFASSDFSGRALEDTSLESAVNLYGGYAASKWCAEKWLLSEASKNSSKLSIYRLGLLMSSTPHPKTPFVPVTLAVRAYGLPARALVADHEKFDATPMSYATEALCSSFQESGIFHVAGSNTLSASELFSCLEDIHNPNQHHNSWPYRETKDARRLLGRWFEPQYLEKMWWTDIFQSSKIIYDTKNMDRFVPREGWDKNDLKCHLDNLHAAL